MKVSTVERPLFVELKTRDGNRLVSIVEIAEVKHGQWGSQFADVKLKAKRNLSQIEDAFRTIHTLMLYEDVVKQLRLYVAH